MAAGEISDPELRRQLKAFGENVGPVTATTRSPLLRKLKRLQNEYKSSQPPQNKRDFAPSSSQGALGPPSRITARNLPFLVVLWLGITSIVCIIDALFVLLRPHTLPGGKWNYIFQPYFASPQVFADWCQYIPKLADNIYIEVDTGYKDLKDAFVIGQSWMNVVEVCLNIITLMMYSFGKTGQSVLLAFMVSTMTFSKTVLFVLISSGLCGCHTHVSLDDWKKTLYLYIVPNGIWIVVPMLCMVATGKIMLSSMKNYETKTTKRKLH